MDRKAKLRVFGKLLDAGFDDDKKVLAFELKDVMTTDLKIDDVPVIVELQEAVKNHKVIAFFADEAKKNEKKDEGGTY